MEGVDVSEFHISLKARARLKSSQCIMNRFFKSLNYPSKDPVCTGQGDLSAETEI